MTINTKSSMPCKVSDATLEKMHKDAVRMLSLKSPAVNDEWWRTFLAIVEEVQDSRGAPLNKEGE